MAFQSIWLLGKFFMISVFNFLISILEDKDLFIVTLISSSWMEYATGNFNSEKLLAVTIILEELQLTF